MKYELGQLIFYVRENKAHSAPILARMRVENQHEEWVANKEQAGLFTPFGPARTVYGTCHGLVDEREAFASKEDMVSALLDA